MSEDATYDLVVIGSGTGLLAAVTAGELGLTVLVVEKSEWLGGSTAMSGGGFWIPNNSVLREAGIVDSSARVTAYLDSLVGGTAPRERRLAFVHHGPAAVDALRRNTPNRWLHMREYADYFPELEGGSAVGRAVEPAPLDLRIAGPDAERIHPPGLETPVPMPITSGDYRWMNLATRSPRGVARVARRLAQGVGGAARGREYVAGGRALAAALVHAARMYDVHLWTETRLRDLVVEGGRVIGVVLEQEGREVTAYAERGVILAGGGFERHAAMRHDYQSPLLDVGWSFAHEENTGDAIRVAQRAGAALTLMDEAWWFPAVPGIGGGKPTALLAERSLPGSIIVDGDGSRYLNEAVDYMTAGQIMLGRDDPAGPRVPSWLVFDQRFRNRYLFGGVLLPRQPLPKSWYAAGLAHRAATVEGLAQKVDLPDLPETVARFNLMAAQGHDDDFQRGESAYDRYYGDPTVTPNPNLAPLDHGPFYAVQVVPGDLGTCGGVRADGLARALREDGSAIEGLYATGNCAGNAFGRFYPGPGATIGQGLTFAYVAAMHAAEKLTD
jgi:succinate dehydrogenase/fumarate reductase flavoprotein subunit